MRGCQSKRVDWWHIITDLCRHGHTHASIGISIGVGKSTVNDWKNNEARPKFDEGDVLVRMWCEITGNSRESVPRLR